MAKSLSGKTSVFRLRSPSMKFPDNITIISDEVSQDLPVISAFVREFRLPGIELRSLNGRAFKDLTRSDIAEVNTASRAEGWRVVGCATPVFKCDLDDTTAIAAHRDIFKRSLEVAHELNAGLLRVFTFLRTPHPASPPASSISTSKTPSATRPTRPAPRTSPPARPSVSAKSIGPPTSAPSARPVTPASSRSRPTGASKKLTKNSSISPPATPSPTAAKSPAAPVSTI